MTGSSASNGRKTSTSTTSNLALIVPHPDLPADAETQALRPLADRMRPRVLDEFIGQQHIVGPGKPLRRAIEEDRLHSMIFWSMLSPLPKLI